jgi:hypothetical protein
MARARKRATTGGTVTGSTTATPPPGSGVTTVPTGSGPTFEPGDATAVTTATTDGYIGWFKVDEGGCVVRISIGQTGYRLPVSNPNYNAMVAMLLACWVNRAHVWIEHSLPIHHPLAEGGDLTIVGLDALPAGSEG